MKKPIIGIETQKSISNRLVACSTNLDFICLIRSPMSMLRSWQRNKKIIKTDTGKSNGTVHRIRISGQFLNSMRSIKYWLKYYQMVVVYSVVGRVQSCTISRSSIHEIMYFIQYIIEKMSKKI